MTNKKIMKFENVEYLWYDKKWYRLYNNTLVHTALSQKLTLQALKVGLITKEDL